MIKSAVGAVFNMKLALGEIILGIPPLDVTRRVNTIKHFLKINISQLPRDPLAAHILDHLQSHRYSTTVSKIKDVFQFLQWKISNYPESIAGDDKAIINNNDYLKFMDLSTRTCSYTKPLMKRYTEEIWQSRINYQYHMEGYANPPIVSCNKISLKSCHNRELETLVLSLFYPNNLMNSFLYRYNKEKYTTPLCNCDENEQTAVHLITQCAWVNKEQRDKITQILMSDPPYNTVDLNDDRLFLVNWSRKQHFLDLCIKIMNNNLHRLRTDIKL